MTATELDRVTSATLRVLDVLVDPSRHPSSSYAFRIARLAGVHVGSVYPILARLEKKGWLSGKWEDRQPDDGRPHRRFYELTSDGMEAAQKLLQSRQVPRRLVGYASEEPVPISGRGHLSVYVGGNSK